MERLKIWIVNHGMSSMFPYHQFLNLPNNISTNIHTPLFLYTADVSYEPNNRSFRNSIQRSY